MQLYRLVSVDLAQKSPDKVTRVDIECAARTEDREAAEDKQSPLVSLCTRCFMMALAFWRLIERNPVNFTRYRARS